MTDIKAVPNQKIVKINKTPVKGQLFAQFNLEAMQQAARDLDAGAFKLWCYFAKNMNDYEFALSSKDAEATMGIKIKQYNNAIAELIYKNYLVLSNPYTNQYIFYDISRTYDDNEEIRTSNRLKICHPQKK